MTNIKPYRDFFETSKIMTELSDGLDAFIEFIKNKGLHKGLEIAKHQMKCMNNDVYL